MLSELPDSCVCRIVDQYKAGVSLSRIGLPYGLDRKDVKLVLCQNFRKMIDVEKPNPTGIRLTYRLLINCEVVALLFNIPTNRVTSVIQRAGFMFPTHRSTVPFHTLLEEYQNGAGTKTLAKRYSVDWKTIQAWFTVLGIDRKTRHNTPHRSQPHMAVNRTE